MYTKFDLVSSAVRDGSEGVERNYKDKYGEVIERLTKPHQIPYTVVTSTSTFGLSRLHWHLPAVLKPETLQRLVEITRENMKYPKGRMNRIQNRIFTCNFVLPNPPVPNNEASSEEEDTSDSDQVALATAQQVDMKSKTAASIK